MNKDSPSIFVCSILRLTLSKENRFLLKTILTLLLPLDIYGLRVLLYNLDF